MSNNTYFPIFLRLDNRRVVVVGGGEVALRKVRLLMRSGAAVDIIARRLHPELRRMVLENSVSHSSPHFNASHLDGCCYVVAATNDASVNAAVAKAAMDRNLFVNVVDDARLSTAIVPSVVDRAPVTVAISSAGAAPVLVRKLREQIEALLPSNLGVLARFISRRRFNRDSLLNSGGRRMLWERFLDSPGAEAVLSGDEARGDLMLAALGRHSPVCGEVYLVGAGPGDPGLLTLRALQLMQQADAVLYDRLLGPRILDLVRRDAERVFVGKEQHRHVVSQAAINAELVRRARAGQRVLRLKGGDPFVFGRGGEEIQTLASEGIPFQVVPGITAANGCAAYAGIPLTHRDYAQACVFVTGHAKADGTLSLPWESLTRPGQTVVIYMGLGSLPVLCQALHAHGLPEDWPAALIADGTRATQKVIVSTLAELPQCAEQSGVQGPSLVIVGEVVRLRDKLQWFRGTLPPTRVDA